MKNVLMMVLGCLGFVALHGQNYSGRLVMDDVELSVVLNANEVTITMIGPVDVWFAFGFGTEVMKGSYALVVDTSSVEERFLKGRNEGELLPKNIEVLSNTIKNKRHTVVLKRRLKGQSEQHYSFVRNGRSIPIIYAIGKNEKTNRKHAIKGNALLVFKKD